MVETPEMPEISDPTPDPTPGPVRSSFCSGGECIEVERTRSFIVIRDSEVPEVFMEATPEQFTAFVRGCKNDDFDRFVNVPSANPAVDSLEGFTPAGDGVRGVYGNDLEDT